MAIKRLKIFWVVLLSATLFTSFGQSNPKLRFITNPDDLYIGSVELNGLDKFSILQASHLLDKNDWSEIFRLYPQGAQINEQPPMLGVYEVSEERIIFTPRFPFIQGKSYQVYFNLPQFFISTGQQIPKSLPFILESTFEVPIVRFHSPPKVSDIYPSNREWPQNQLKFYIEFSNPMRVGNAFKYLKLLKENGDTVDLPFLEEELWSPDRQRLTVWFDPGRIKTGLIPNEESGPLLVEDRRYRLAIDQSWKDIYGQRLLDDYSKVFQTTLPDHQQPDVKRWKISSPKNRSLDTLKVYFDESLDYALATTAIAVFNKNGVEVSGQIVLGDLESVWFFIPERAWYDEEYILRIDTDIEDLAGNNLERLFDTDLEVEKEPHHSKAHLELSFKTRLITD